MVNSNIIKLLGPINVNKVWFFQLAVLAGGGDVACYDFVGRSAVTAAIGWPYWRGGSG